MTCPSCDGTITRAIQSGRADMTSTWERCPPCAESEAALWEKFRHAIIVPPTVIRRARD